MLSNTQRQTKIAMKVFYRPEQVAINANDYSPSAYKPKQVVEDWLASGLIDTRDIKRLAGHQTGDSRLHCAENRIHTSLSPSAFHLSASDFAKCPSLYPARSLF